MSSVVPAVEEAIAGLREAFAPSSLEAAPDGAGGAFVVLDPVPLGDTYRPGFSWYGFHLSAMLPDADVYPLYLRGDLVRTDGQPHRDTALQQVTWRGRSALQLSRRSNRRDPAIDSPARKAARVLDWFRCL